MANSKSELAAGEYSVQPVQQTVDGYGFNITGKRWKRIVHFSYASEEEAREARSVVNWVTLKAQAIIPFS